MTQAGRRKPTRDERQAAAYLMITRGDGTPIVSREDVKHLTAREIIETFEERVHWDHIAARGFRKDDSPEEIARVDHPSNIQPLAIEQHGEKTPRDIRNVAKAKRVEKKHQDFRRRMLAKTGHSDGCDVPKTRTTTSFGKQQMPFGRGSKLKKKMDGTVIERRRQT